MLGRHRLIGRLGGGGMGVVYLAEGPQGRVAVKLIRADLVDDPDYRLRFQREIQACFRVSSAHTARLVDFELEADRPWLATEFVDGTDLHQRVRTDGPLSQTAQLALAVGLAEALASIHAAGLVHRDLKPSNVLWTANGPQVIDFGIAATADARPLTAVGQFIGTPTWFSPEQAAGGEATAAADVFAWGGLLCFAATGVPPFGTGQPEVVLNRVRFAQPDVDYDRVAPPLRALVRRTLAREPERRPSAQTLHDKLADSAEATASTVRRVGFATAVTRVPPPGQVVPVEPSPPAPAIRPARTRRRGRRYAGYAVVATVVLAVAGIVAGTLADAGGDSSDGSGSTSGSSALEGTYQADGPWRIVIRDTIQNTDNSCEVTLKNADTGEQIGQAVDLQGTWSFQVSASGSYRWYKNDPDCLVEARTGTGTATLPFAQQANTGDTDAFTAPARVAVEVIDFNGSEECSPTLHDATNGEVLDSASVNHGSAGPLLLDPKGRTQVFLNDSSDHACGMRLSAATA